MCSIKVDLSNIPLIFSIFKPFERFWRCRFFRSGFGYAGFSYLEDFWARRLPDDFQKVFWRSLLPCLPFIIDLSVLVSSYVDFSSFGNLLLHKIHTFSQTKTLQTHYNLFDLKTPNFIWIFHFCLISFSLIYLFVASFNQMVLIFHLDMYFVCSIKVCISNFPLIFSVFNSFERFWICRFFRSGFDM